MPNMIFREKNKHIDISRKFCPYNYSCIYLC